MTDAFLSFNDSKTKFNNTVSINKDPSSDSVALDMKGALRVCKDVTSDPPDSRPKVILNNTDTGHDLVSIEASQTSTGFSTLFFKTRNNNTGLLDEKLRFNYAGALGIGGANFGSNGQVLTSKGSTNVPEWETFNAGSGGGSVNFTNYSSGAIPATNAQGSYVLAEGNLELPAAEEGRYLTILTTSSNTTSNSSTFSKIEEYIASSLTIHLGRSVAINSNGNVIAIGTENSTQNSNLRAGDVEIYRKNSSGEYVSEKTITGTYKDQNLGWTMDMNSDGDRLAIHSFSKFGNTALTAAGLEAGFTDIYDYSSGNWTLQHTFKGNDIQSGSNTHKGYGRPAISKDGNTIMLSSWHNNDYLNNNGYVQVFTYNGTTWVQKGATFASTSDFYGSDIDVNSDGTRILIGHAKKSSEDGEVRVYTYNDSNSTWVQYGDPIEGASGGDEELGRSAKFDQDGEKIVIGSPLHDKNTSTDATGKVAVYSSPSSSTGTWQQLGSELNIEDLSDLTAGDRFGYYVDITDDGNTVIAASRKYLSNDGIVRIYSFTDNDWVKTQDITRPSGEKGGLRGFSLSRDGSHIGLGLPATVSNSQNNGRALIYSRAVSSSQPALKTITAASGEYINNKNDIIVNRYKHFACANDGHWLCSPEPYYFSANLGETNQTVNNAFNIIEFIPSLTSPYDTNNSDMTSYKWTCPDDGLYSVNVTLTSKELTGSSVPAISSVKISLYLSDGTVETPVLCSVQDTQSPDYITLNLSGLVKCFSTNKLYVKGKIEVASGGQTSAGIWLSKFIDGSDSIGYASVFNLTRVI